MLCSIVPPMEPSPGTSAWEQDISCQSRGVRGLTCHYNISSEAQKCIEFFHRDSTRIHYGCKFCDRWHADPYRPTVTLVIDFLTEQFDNGKSNLGVVTNAHSALEIYFPHYMYVYSNYMIKRLVDGFSTVRPQMPRIKDKVWDANIVIDFLHKLPDYDVLPLHWHSIKLTLFIFLCTMSRKCATFVRYRTNGFFLDGVVTVTLTGPLKQQRACTLSKCFKQVDLLPYPQDQRVWPMKCLLEYLNNMKYIRPPDQTRLFLRSVPPFKVVSNNTYVPWVKKRLQYAGIYLKAFSLHSTHASAASTAFQTGIPINEILLRAGWSSIKTFIAYYSRQLVFKLGISLVDSSFLWY